MVDVKHLYERLRTLPFPSLGKQVGNFSLYDALVAGCADRALRGELAPAAQVPVPDDETIKQVHLLHKKHRLTEEESEFLEYFDLLERLRLLLQGSNQRGQK